MQTWKVLAVAFCAFSASWTLCLSDELMWFTDMSAAAQERRSEQFESNHTTLVTFLKLDRATLDQVGSMSARARYNYCQQSLYLRLLSGFEKLDAVVVTTNAYPAWDDRLVAARAKVMVPQGAARKKGIEAALSKRGGSAKKALMEVGDIDRLLETHPVDGSQMFLLLLPQDVFSMMLDPKLLEEINDKFPPPSTNKSAQPHVPDVLSSEQSPAVRVMDDKTAERVRALAVPIKRVSKLQQEGHDFRGALLEAEALAEKWPDNPLSASCYDLLARYWRALWTDKNDSECELKFRQWAKRALSIYGEDVCHEQLTCALNSATNIQEYVAVYSSLWAFQNDRGRKFYPIRDISAYLGDEREEYWPAQYSEEELLRRSNFLKKRASLLEILESNVVMRLKDGMQIKWPAESKGSPLWEMLRAKGMLIADTPVVATGVVCSVAALTNSDNQRHAVVSVEKSVQKVGRSQSANYPLRSSAWWGLGIVVVGGIWVLLRKRR